MLYKNSEFFVVYVAALKALPRSAKIRIHQSKIVQITALKQDKALTKVLPKYEDYADIFSFELAIELQKNPSINKHHIKIEKSK